MRANDLWVTAGNCLIFKPEQFYFCTNKNICNNNNNNENKNKNNQGHLIKEDQR